MIADIVTNLTSFSLPGLLTVVGVFGFAPGLCMRLIALMYPRTHPRRRELHAEMKIVPRIERPFWVAEQLEEGLSEGLRLRQRAAKKRKQAKNGPDPYTNTSVRVARFGRVIRELHLSEDEEELLRILRRHGVDDAPEALALKIKRDGLDNTWREVSWQLRERERY
ncbi:hypothetical protein [Saccharopolyspora dendranthemae]|uniref:Uncharacterized protein n=1 Tax=Saccharopolyspora dendranthemae TaxID=1181886 RepID=A0A561V7G8_9PSEU|nr:hypothetical protein [Saccharopolyspora dendranthemae]TWG07567.1 hypothetical protein FHU35_11184 [Saccharopolyspora dendranthemae]